MARYILPLEECHCLYSAVRLSLLTMTQYLGHKGHTISLTSPCKERKYLQSKKIQNQVTVTSKYGRDFYQNKVNKNRT